MRKLVDRAWRCIAVIALAALGAALGADFATGGMGVFTSEISTTMAWGVLVVVLGWVVETAWWLRRALVYAGTRGAHRASKNDVTTNVVIVTFCALMTLACLGARLMP